MSIYYNPNIIYKLDDLPPYKLKNNVLSEDILIESSVLEESSKKVLSDIDFLINLCEQELKDKSIDCTPYTNNNNFLMEEYQELALKTEDSNLIENDISYEELECDFSNYKKAAIKKYYCNLPLNQSENLVINKFEEEVGGIKGTSAIDIYPTALTLKKELENDREEIIKDSKLRESSLDYILDNIEYKLSKYGTYLDDFKLGYDKDAYDSKLQTINRRINRLEEAEKLLKQEYKKSVSEGNRERALTVKDAMKAIEKDIDDTKSNLSFIATTTHAYLRKAQSADNYIEKMAFTLMASPLDKLDKTICCLLKLIIKQADIDLSTKEIDETFYKRLQIPRILNALKAIKGILNIMFYEGKLSLDNLLNKFINFLSSPVRSIISRILNIITEYKIKAIGSIEDLFGAILTSDYDNPDNILDCIHFEAFGDFIYEGMEDLDNELRTRITDFYKFIYNATDILGDHALEIEKREKIRQIINILDLLINILEDVDEFAKKLSGAKVSPQKALEHVLENILVRNNLGTTYNSRTGRYERISLDGCLDQGRDTGNFRDYMSSDYEDMPSIDLDKDRRYKRFIDNHVGYDYECEF